MPRIPLVVLLVAPLFAGCVVTPPVENAYSQSYAGSLPVRVLNASSRPICYVHIAPAGSSDWGDDWLGSSETIPSGTMRPIGGAPGVYNVRLDDCQRSPVQVLMAVDFTGPREILIHEGTPPQIAPTPGFGRIELVAMPAQTFVAEAGGGGGDGGGWSSEPQAERAEPSFASSSEPQPAAPSGPAHYSLTLHNSCPHSVGLYHGTGSGRPPFASGTYGSIGANTTESFSGFAPESFWIVDDSRNGISSFTATGGSQRVEITASCSGFAAN